jgi:NTP pyrophosphatase (non-canonical NTP hydrolase)
MKTALEMVAEFHCKHDQPLLDHVATCAEVKERRRLRWALVSEEGNELRRALGIVTEDELFDNRSQEPDLVQVADALADLAYVVIGTALEFGLPLDRVFAEVHRSNMTKDAGNVRGDGKILKGPSFSPPRIADVLWPADKP